MQRKVLALDLTKHARLGRHTSTFGVAILLVATIAVPGTRAMAGTPGTSAIALTCNKATQHVGPFDVVCGGSGSRFVQITASATSCSSASGAPSSCAFRFWVKRRGSMGWDAISFLGGGVTQSRPVSTKIGTGSGGTTGSTTTTSSTGDAGAGGTRASGASPTTTAPAPPAISAAFQEISWTCALLAPRLVARVVTLVVTTGVGHALRNPTYGVVDSKNIADGAAQQVAVE